MPAERVLICGAGVAGSTLAFWLAKYDFQVVVVERSRAEQKAGQGIEIEEPALTVVRQMGILDTLKSKRTVEKGFILVDDQSRSFGKFEVGGASPTGELELMRGDLTEVLYKAADEFPNVTYHFETTIQGLRQTKDKVVVDLENRRSKTTKTEEFHLVIGADGVKSRTRELAMGSPEKLDCFKPVGAYVAYFSIPKEDKDSLYSQCCHFPGRRIVWLRPAARGSDTTSVYLIHVKDNIPALRQANASGDRLKQKEGFAEIYRGLGWETPRVIEQMMKADNFYSDELAQVKLPKWSQGRVAIVGDAAWAPTPFTGEGNQLALIGAWVLAQEMSRNRSPVAFENYEKRLRPYVEDLQSIPLGGYAPYIFDPETIWGIWVLRMIFLLLSYILPVLKGAKLDSLFPDKGHSPFDLEVDNAKAKKTQ